MKNTSQQERKALKIQQTSFSGPLPPPEILAGYDKVVNGAAERIIRMAEKEMEHRHKNEDITEKNLIRTTYISIFFAFLSVLILCGIVFYALYKGYATVAGVIATGAIATVAGVFISHKMKKQ